MEKKVVIFPNFFILLSLFLENIFLFLRIFMKYEMFEVYRFQIGGDSGCEQGLLVVLAGIGVFLARKLVVV